MSSFTVCVIKCFSVTQIKEDVMGYGRCETEEEFGGGGCLKERDHLEDEVVDGRLVLKWALTKQHQLWT